MDITEFRGKNPDYNDLDDAELTKLLHQKFYSDIPLEEFSQKFSGGASSGGEIKLPEWLQKMSDKQAKPGFERDILPILGDVAGGLIPTPFGGKAKAATGVAKLGFKAANLLMKSAQAGAGSGIGEFAAQKQFGEDTDPEKIKSQALWGAAGEGISPGIGKVLKPVFKWASSLTATGGGAKEWARRNVIKKTGERATAFINDAAPDIVKKAGMGIDIDDLGLSVSKAFDETKVIYDAYGKYIDSMAKNAEGGVLLDDTQQLLFETRQKWIDEAYEKFDLKRDIEDITKKGLPEWYAVTRGSDHETKIINGIKETYGWGDTSPQSLILKRSMMEDVIAPDDLKQLLTTFWKKGKKSDYGNLTATQKTNRENLKKAVLDDIEKASPEGRALKELGDKHWGEISNFNSIQKIYNSALKDMPSGDKYLNPTLLSKNIYKNEKRIKDIMPDKWPALKAEADFYKKVAENWRPPQPGASNMLLGGLKLGSGAIGPALTTFTVGPQWIPVVESFGLFSAWMHLKPGARKIMGQVAKNTIIKPAVHTLPGMINE